MLQLSNITKQFHGKRNNNSFTLGEINLSFPNKGLISILGRSGSGKTTLLNVIGGIITPSTGKILYENLNSDLLTDLEYDYIRNHYIGFIFQEFYLVDKLTVYENIKIALDLQNCSDGEIENKIDDALEKLEISYLKNREVSDLSGGEKQRVSIARVIAKGCNVILADEPTGALDENTAESVMNILKTLSNSVLIVLVTHDREYAYSYSDRVLTISNGKIIKDENINEIKEDSMKNIQVISEKLKFKNIFSLSNKVLTKRVKKFIFTILFWMISAFALLVSLNLSLINQNDFVIRSIEENNINHFKIVKNISLTEEVPNSINDIDKYRNLEFQTITFNSYFYCGSNFYYDSIYPLMSYKYDRTLDLLYGQKLFNYIEVVDDITFYEGSTIYLEDYEIVITDFIAGSLIYRDIIDVENANDVKGKKLLVNNKELIIKDIIPTDYKKFLSTEYSNNSNWVPDFLNSNEYFDKLRNEYSTIYMNYNTLDYLNRNESEFKLVINGGESKVFNINNSNFSEGTYLGKIPFNNHEMIVDMAFLHIVTGEKVTFEGLSSFLNKSYDIKFYNKDNILETHNYTIVGIKYSNRGGSGMFVTENEYKKLEENYASDIPDTYIKGYAATLGTKDENKELIKKLLENNDFMYNFYSAELWSGISVINDFKFLFRCITLGTLVFLILIIYYFTSQLIIDNKRTIGILSSLGCGKKDFISLFIFENIKILAISFLSATILHALMIDFISKYIKKITDMSLQIVRYKILAVPIVLVIILIITLLSSYSPINKLRKKDLVTIIYDR